jgi:hypothetical protein
MGFPGSSISKIQRVDVRRRISAILPRAKMIKAIHNLLI